MGFEALPLHVKPETARRAAKAPVHMVARVASRTNSGGFRIILRPELLGLDWLKAGERVSLLWGTGSDRGLLRVVQNGDVSVSKIGAPSARGNPLSIAFRPAFLTEPEARKPVACAHRMIPRGIDITLPDWAVPPLAAAAPLASAAPEVPTAPAMPVNLAASAGHFAPERRPAMQSPLLAGGVAIGRAAGSPIPFEDRR